MAAPESRENRQKSVQNFVFAGPLDKFRTLFGGGSFVTYIWDFLLPTGELFCLQSIQVLIRGTFQL